jgi:hypothetical protein
MTLYEFNMLDLGDKYQTTWDLGLHIDSVITEEFRINLYAINKFYVEVYYNPESNKIEGIKSFIHGHRLEKYSGNINL